MSLLNALKGTKSPKMLRQGDVLLIKRTRPTDSAPTGRDAKYGDRIVLAYGEVTGHAHTIVGDPSVALLFDIPGQATMKHLVVKEKTELMHVNPDLSGTGEHNTLELLPGEYDVIRQREWDDEAERNERLAAD